MINLTVYTAVTCTYGSRKPTTVASLAGDNVVRQDLHFRTYIKPTLKLVPTIRTGKVEAAKATPESICSYHILKQLKVVTGKGNRIIG